MSDLSRDGRAGLRPERYPRAKVGFAVIPVNEPLLDGNEKKYLDEPVGR